MVLNRGPSANTAADLAQDSITDMFVPDDDSPNGVATRPPGFPATVVDRV